MPNEYVGILVNDPLYRGIPLRRTGYESLRSYERAGAQYGLTPCYFRLTDVCRGDSRVRAFVRQSGRYVRRTVPLPRVIHNRGLWFHTGARRIIDRWTKKGHIVFNQWNRYGKQKIHALLMLEPALRPHLPHTLEAAETELGDMMRLHASLIVKPKSGSVGCGIMKLDRLRHGLWRLDYPAARRSRKRLTAEFAADAIPRPLRRVLDAGTHMIQQRLPLAAYHGCPFDLRVSVQKNITGDWQVTGLNVKVARKEAFLTNVAQGAVVYDLPTVISALPELQPQLVRADVEALSLHVARQLERHLPHLADIGLDIGVTEYGFAMFIECNGRDQRYSFKEAGLIAEWQASYANPIGYARYLLDQLDSSPM